MSTAMIEKKVYRCPICGHELKDLERVTATHTPASVPQYVSAKTSVYSMTERYTIAQCDRDHRFQRGEHGGLSSTDQPTAWRHE